MHLTCQALSASYLCPPRMVGDGVMISRQCQGYPPTEAGGWGGGLRFWFVGSLAHTHDWWRDTNEKAWVSARVHVNIYEGLEGLSGKCMAWYIFNWAISYAAELMSEALRQAAKG